VQNGTWTELFRDDQNAPLFDVMTGPAGADPSTGLNMFDLSVRAVGNTLAIQVIDGMGNVIDYPLIVDNDNPLLTGTVGLTTWGSEHDYFMSFGGESGPLLTIIPEPASVVLLVSIGGLLALRRWRR
jgi:hypothetical protein